MLLVSDWYEMENPEELDITIFSYTIPVIRDDISEFTHKIKNKFRFTRTKILIEIESQPKRFIIKRKIQSMDGSFSLRTYIAYQYYIGKSGTAILELEDKITPNSDLHLIN